MPSPFPKRMTRTTFWTATAFYLLIAFEFFYMATPFALYFYGAYRPALKWLNSLPGFSWLTRFFLPHYATYTSSTLVNVHNEIGAIIMLAGLLAFAAGAAQVYYAKLAHKGAVTGGVYRFIRHPQYAALMVSGFGLLLLWPRFLALVFFVTMLFAYHWLAQVEENECEQKFGESYRIYQRRTARFLPFQIPLLTTAAARTGEWIRHQSPYVRRVLVFAFFGVALASAVGLATHLQSYSVKSQHAIYLEDAAFVAICDVDKAELSRVVEIASRDPELALRMSKKRSDGARGFINYVVPAAWFIPEIPMLATTNTNHDHSTPNEYDRNQMKVIFTWAEYPDEDQPQRYELLRKATVRTAFVEAFVDVAKGDVTRVVDPPAQIMYEAVPVPVL